MVQFGSNTDQMLDETTIETNIQPETNISTSTQKTTPAIVPPHPLRFISVALSSHVYKVTIEVEGDLYRCLFDQTLDLFSSSACDGFDRDKTPRDYVKEMYAKEIGQKIQNYFFYHLVTDFVINELIARKINSVNYPRLASIEHCLDKKVFYHFDVSVADPLELKEWKHFAFKPPKRKRYKDLDKQVESFVDQQPENTAKQNPNRVGEGDWVYFQASMIDAKQQEISPHLSCNFWVCTSNQGINDDFINQLIGKEIGESFTTKFFSYHEQESESQWCFFPFNIVVKAIVKGGYFSLEIFKNTFKLKNKNDVHNKLMEIFSYRHDQSQRKAIIDEVFHLLLSKHRFEVPKHHVLRREEDLVHFLSKEPDYYVYKSQRDFHDYVELLAEKQLKEEIIIDQIAYNENIRIETRDIAQYLHLFSNKRLREFIYFRPIAEKVDSQTAPINTTILMQSALREKTINQIIHTLTR